MIDGYWITNQTIADMHFQKIRMLTTASRVIAPGIVFVAFLLYLKYGFLVGLLASWPAFFLLGMFPSELRATPEPSFSHWVIHMFYVAGIFCFIYWAEDMPWCQELWKQLMSRDGMWDWRLIVAVYLWCCAWCFAMVMEVRAMTDEEILSIYQSKDDQAGS